MGDASRNPDSEVVLETVLLAAAGDWDAVLSACAKDQRLLFASYDVRGAELPLEPLFPQCPDGFEFPKGPSVFLVACSLGNVDALKRLFAMYDLDGAETRRVLRMQDFLRGRMGNIDAKLRLGLDYAALYGHLSLCRFLISRGVNLQVNDDEHDPDASLMVGDKTGALDLYGLRAPPSMTWQEKRRARSDLQKELKAFQAAEVKFFSLVADGNLAQVVAAVKRDRQWLEKEFSSGEVDGGGMGKGMEVRQRSAHPQLKSSSSSSFDVPKHYTPVMLAARQGHSHVVAALADLGADLNHAPPGDFGLENNAATPLAIAVRRGDVEMARLLLSLGAYCGADILSAVREHPRFGRKETLKLMSEASRSGPYKREFRSLLGHALSGEGGDASRAVLEAVDGDPSLLMTFLDREFALLGSDFCESLFSAACIGGNVELVAGLLDRMEKQRPKSHCDSFCQICNYSMRFAAQWDNLAVCELLLSRGHELQEYVEEDYGQPWHDAAIKEWFLRSEEETAAGAAAAVQQKSGRSSKSSQQRLAPSTSISTSSKKSSSSSKPLSNKVRAERIAALRAAFARGPSARADQELLALLRHAELGDTAAVLEALDRSSSSSGSSGQPSSTLLQARWLHPDQELQGVLVKAGTDVLCSACRSGNIELVRALIDRGARVVAVGRGEKGALAVAAELDRFDICALLVSRSAILHTMDGMHGGPRGLRDYGCLANGGRGLAPAVREQRLAGLRAELATLQRLSELAFEGDEDAVLAAIDASPHLVNQKLHLPKEDSPLHKIRSVAMQLSDAVTLLSAAVYGSRLALVDALLRRGAVIGRHDLFMAAMSGQAELCELLIAHGADLRAPPSGDDELTICFFFGRRNRDLGPEEVDAGRRRLRLAFAKGPHPSQVKRRQICNWLRRRAFVRFLCESALRPLAHRKATDLANNPPVPPSAAIPALPSATPEQRRGLLLGAIFANDEVARQVAAFL